MKNGLHIIDADAHVFDGDAVYRPRLSARFSRRASLFAGNDGFDRGRKANTRYRELTAYKGVIPPDVYLKDMDVEGIDVQVVYPTSGLGYAKLREREYCIELARGYNDWLSEWCSADPGRLKGVAIVPIHVDVDEAIKEMERACGPLGLCGVVIAAHLRDRNVASHEFWPFYEACATRGVAVAFHGSGQDQLDPVCHFANFLAMHTFSHVPQQIIACTAVFTSGLLETYPDLRVAFLEAGCGWVPFWMDHMDEEWEEIKVEGQQPEMPPSELMRSGRVYVTCKPNEPSLPYVVSRFGDEFLLFPSDYPHFDCAFPEAVSKLADREDISPETLHRIFWENPQRLYGFTA